LNCLRADVIDLSGNALTDDCVGNLRDIVPLTTSMKLNSNEFKTGILRLKWPAYIYNLKLNIDDNTLPNKDIESIKNIGIIPSEPQIIKINRKFDVLIEDGCSDAGAEKDVDLAGEGA
jgi:hypothetical protein